MPSSMPVNSPSTTTPISSSSRFSARPSVPSAKRTSSFAMTEGRPSMCAMPSPASVTCPTSVVCAWPGSYDETNSERAERISSGLMESSAIVFPFSVPVVQLLVCRGGGRRSFHPASAGKLLPQRAEARGDAAVDDVVADLHANPTEHGGIDDGVDPECTAVLCLESLHEPVELCSREGRSRRDRDDLEPALLGDDRGGVPKQLADAAAARLLHEV